ncbi:MAG TPA: ATP-binding protein, partial [Polyangiaceae bacterium]|nr:ATP-binding protein [Polyangiaceae bacterium]
DGLVELDARFSIDNHPSSLAPLVRHLETLLVRMGLGDETDCIQIAVALREALTNAVEHGNLELSSILKDNGAYDAQAEERRSHDPWKQRRVEVRVRMTRDAVEYVVTDEGPGFDRSLLPDPTDPSNLERSHGRGLMLIGTFMDEVRHNDRGNVITMVKRRRNGA